LYIFHALMISLLFCLSVEVHINVDPLSFDENWYIIIKKEKNWMGLIVGKLRLEFQVFQIQ
jgi:hypothetical protein